MQLGYVIHYVEDVAQSLAFYESAFGCAQKFLHESGDYGELDTGATTLAFVAFSMLREAGKAPARPDPKAPSGEIAFVTGDVAAAFARALKAGAAPLQEPAEMPWGQTIAYVSDRDGFLVELCTEVAG